MTDSSASFSRNRWGVSIKATVVLVAAFMASAAMTTSIHEVRGKYVKESISEFGQLPSMGVQTLSLEFKGIIADYLFFKTLTYLGLKIGEKKNPSPEEWQLIHQMITRVTDLDGRFWDAYIFAEMILAWQAGMIEEANQLLLKAAQNRPEDYRPLYYIGFNYFYFKKDAEKAAPYLRQAAQFPNAPFYFKGLAARLSLYGNQTGMGIAFLENLIKDNPDPKIAKYMEKRLIALKMLYYLEQGVLEYKKRNGEFPKQLEALISAGLIRSIPKDPYGGKFMLLGNGRVYTTSKLTEPSEK